MRSVLRAWLLALPLIAASSQVAHWLAYRLAEPDAHARAHELAQTGHGYTGVLRLAVIVSLCLLVALLAANTRDALRGRARLRVERWPFVLVPVVGFAVQELVERLAVGGEALGTIGHPAVLIGFALQLPIALAAYALGRLLLAASELIAVALQAPPRERARRTPAATIPAEPLLASISPLASCKTPRGPPRPLLT
ncbi:MAG: hypothetical protein OXG37_01695 [Actinomycetia bacterium]|nr:hypothetical protein [Actinomycetes bacterium]